MELLAVSKKINLKINELEEAKKELHILAQSKSTMMVTYEKAVSIEIVNLLSKKTPTAIVDKIARGNCAELHGAMDLAESAYKNCLKIIDITQSQLNGYQSINRYLSEL